MYKGFIYHLLCLLTSDKNTRLPGAEVGAAVEVALGNEGMVENTSGGDSLISIPLEHGLQQLNTFPPLIRLFQVVHLQTHLV